jgi:hypothetical protein
MIADGGSGSRESTLTIFFLHLGTAGQQGEKHETAHVIFSIDELSRASRAESPCARGAPRTNRKFTRRTFKKGRAYRCETSNS